MFHDGKHVLCQTQVKKRERARDRELTDKQKPAV